MEKIKHRPICITPVSPSNNLNVIETKSFQQKQGCVSNLLDTPKRVRVFPILTVRPCINQGSIRISISDLSNSIMVSSIMASKTITSVCENNSAAPEGFRTFVRSEQENLPISRKRKLSTPGMDGFRKKVSAEGILEESVALITKCKANR